MNASRHSAKPKQRVKTAKVVKAWAIKHMGVLDLSTINTNGGIPISYALVNRDVWDLVKIEIREVRTKRGQMLELKPGDRTYDLPEGTKGEGK